MTRTPTTRRIRRLRDKGPAQRKPTVVVGHIYAFGDYSLRTVPSRIHAGYDGLVISPVGVVAESNGWPTPEEAYASARRDLDQIAAYGGVAGR
jgi:hypothetical protein